MHSVKRVVARGNTGDRPAFADNSLKSAGVVQAENFSAVGNDDLRGGNRGGRRLSAQVGAAEAQCAGRAPDGVGGTGGRQGRLKGRLVSVVPYGRLQKLARARVRKVVRDLGFDWHEFLASDPAWSLTEVVHRKAVQEASALGLDVRPTDVPTDTVLKAVRSVLEEMDADADLRPSQDGFCAEQARRGALGRETQSVEARAREREVMGLVSSGVTNNAEIARRLKVSGSTPGRVRKRVAEREKAAEQVEALVWVFPAADVPACERWPARQFVKQTGVCLDEIQVRWLCDMGRCYEAEGRVDEMMYAIRASAGDGIRDPWAYVQRCVVNRGDTWEVTPQLVGDVLEWAGEDSLRYALTAIAGGYVRRPRAYLERTLQCAAAAGERAPGAPERPVAMALAMCRRWAPELSVDGAVAAIEAEEARSRTGYIRRWDPPVGDGPEMCIGLKGGPGDDLDLTVNNSRNLESSRSKADATPVERDVGSPDGGPPSCGEKLEQGLKPADVADPDGIRRSENRGEARERGETTCRPLPRGNPAGVLEHGPCRHPLAALLVSRMDLEAVVQVECAAGCGHLVYSDRGLVECPCHWPATMAVQVARGGLQVICSTVGAVSDGRFLEEFSSDVGQPLGAADPP